MKKFLLSYSLFVIISTSAQSVLNDNFSSFNLAAINGQSGWNTSSPPGTGGCFSFGCNIQVVNRSMMYTGFGSSTKAINPIMNTTADGPGKNFSSPITSGSCYVTLLLNIAEPTSTTNMQVVRMMDNGFNVATRLYIQKIAAGSFKFGVDKSGSASTQTAANYNYGTDMLIVLKYTYNTGSTTDDAVTLYVNPNITTTEAMNTPALTFSPTSADVTTITRVAFPWNSSTIPTGFIGAVTASTLWGATLPSPFVTNIQLNKIANNKAALTWDVNSNSEVNNFIIQHSTDNNNFSDVGKIDYNGNSKFNQTIDLANGTNYIRLATTNKQGNTLYSQVFVVKSGTVIGSLSVSPNPTKGMLLASIKTEERDALQLQIVDLEGKLISQQTRNVEKGETQISLDVNSLKAGQYILKVTSKEAVQTKLFIKQ